MRRAQNSAKNSARRHGKRVPWSDRHQPQNRRKTGGNAPKTVGRFAHGQNTGDNTEDFELKTRKRSDLFNGLSREQRHFILEKLLGQSDLDAALRAGYALTTAQNTKAKIWARPGVRDEFARLRALMIEQLAAESPVSPEAQPDTHP